MYFTGEKIFSVFLYFHEFNFLNSNGENILQMVIIIIIDPDDFYNVAPFFNLHSVKTKQKKKKKIRVKTNKQKKKKKKQESIRDKVGYMMIMAMYDIQRKKNICNYVIRIYHHNHHHYHYNHRRRVHLIFFFSLSLFLLLLFLWSFSMLFFWRFCCWHFFLSLKHVTSYNIYYLVFFHYNLYQWLEKKQHEIKWKFTESTVVVDDYFNIRR